MWLAIGLTFGLRAVYLARFGWDPMWLNANYLAHAKSLVVGQPRLYGPPLALVALVAERRLGLSAVAALALLALAAHLAFSGGVIALARAVWPPLSSRREGALALLVAATPITAGYAGYEDVGALLGAAFLVWAVAVSLRCSAAPSQRRFALAFACACCGAATRIEAAAGDIALAALLLAVGPSRGLPAARRAGVLVALAVAAGLAATAAAHRAAMGRFELADPHYAFYTFYVGLPPRMCDAPCVDEYRNYAASSRRFGSLAENDGHLLRAATAHPRELASRTAYKIGEWMECFGDPRAAGLLLPLVAGGLFRAGRRSGLEFVLAAFLGPALVLLVPPSEPAYFIVVLPPVLLIAARGAEALTARWPSRARGGLAIAVVLFGLVWAGRFGWRGPSISPVLHDAARALEARCIGGCMTNYLPPHVAAEAWVDLDAGVPLPPAQPVDETFISGVFPAAFVAACRYRDRATRAREAGYAGPVLYLDVQTPTARSYSNLGFDREHDLEGPVDLSHANLEAVFRRGPDVARLWSFPPGVLP